MDAGVQSLMFSSAKDNWATPPDFFAELNREFDFTLDVCAEPHSAKCARYWTKQDDALSRSWAGERCFMNPPYGRTLTGRFMRKAFEESQRGALVVCLVPSRTDTAWFHDYAKQGELRFVRGRLRFDDGPHVAPFPSLVVVFRPTVAQ